MSQTKEERAAYMRSWMRSWRASHPVEVRAYRNTWNAAHRETNKAYARAYREEHRSEIRASNRAYAEIHKEMHHAYREAHRDKYRAYACAWDAMHREERRASCHARRARLLGAIVGPIDLAAIRKRDKMMCCICGKKVAEKDLSFDHTIPLFLGGGHTQELLRVAHRRCNSRRGVGRLPVQMVLF